jgi:hypothetical protein
LVKVYRRPTADLAYQVVRSLSARRKLRVDDPTRRRERFAEEITNNGVAFAVKVYLKSPEAVDEAVELARLVLEER